MAWFKKKNKAGETPSPLASDLHAQAVGVEGVRPYDSQFSIEENARRQEQDDRLRTLHNPDIPGWEKKLAQLKWGMEDRVEAIGQRVIDLPKNITRAAKSKWGAVAISGGIAVGAILTPGNLVSNTVHRELTAPAPESHTRSLVRDVISNHADDITSAATFLMENWDSISTSISRWIKEDPQGQWAAQNTEAVMQWVDEKLEAQYGEEWSKIRNFILLYPRADWVNSAIGTKQQEANWLLIPFLWAGEINLEYENGKPFGNWSIDEKGRTVVEILNPAYANDLAKHPPHLELMNMLATQYFSIDKLQDFSPLRFDWDEHPSRMDACFNDPRPPYDGKYGCNGSSPYYVNNFSLLTIGGYGQQAKHVFVDEENSTIRVDFEWTNTTGPKSGFRKGHHEAKMWADITGGSDNPYRTEDWERGEYGLMGAFRQIYRLSYEVPFETETGQIKWEQARILTPDETQLSFAKEKNQSSLIGENLPPTDALRVDAQDVITSLVGPVRAEYLKAQVNKPDQGIFL